MNSLLILIPVTLLIVLLAAALFFWAVNHQQFDDLDSPGFVPLLEDLPQDRAAEHDGARDARQPSPGPRPAMPFSAAAHPACRTPAARNSGPRPGLDSESGPHPESEH